jgi:dGTPase
VRLVRFDDKTRNLNAELKQFLGEFLYNHESFKAARDRAQHELETLFEYYFTKPDMLPNGHLTRVSQLGLHRIVCDYIAGMTDTFASTKYAEISTSQKNAF